MNWTLTAAAMQLWQTPWRLWLRLLDRLGCLFCQICIASGEPVL
jgi:hypothetical protein